MNRNEFQPENDPARPPYDRQWEGYGQTRRPYQYPGSPTDWREPRSELPVYQPTLPAAGFARQQGRAQPRRRRRRGCTIGCLSTLVIFLVLAIFFFVTAQRVLAFGNAISNQSPLSTQTGYMGGDQRVNFLIMGYGGSGHDGAYLTDSLVVISLQPQSHHTTLISVPRDLWVQNPANSGNYSKINTVYTTASQNNANPIVGGNAVAQKISLITGLRIDYWLTINFTGFKDFIDAVGGIDVNVPDSFTAKYPASDDPAVNPNWITVTFKKGQQHMDGQRAIVYARARYVLDNPAEGSDFARSQRQQLIMKAALTRVKQWQTWPHMFGALDKLQHTLYANLSLADLAELALKMDLNAAHRAGLSNANVLVDATSDNGQAILLPQNNDWALIPAYIQKQLYT
jgi:LCP family protein required for cell wall assembly